MTAKQSLPLISRPDAELRVCGHNLSMDAMIEHMAKRVNQRTFDTDDVADILYVCDYARYMRQAFPKVYADGWWGGEGDQEPEWALAMLRRMQQAMNEPATHETKGTYIDDSRAH